MTLRVALPLLALLPSACAGEPKPLKPKEPRYYWAWDA